MGQKVNPIGLRLGVNKTWQSRWYADSRTYADYFLEDIKIRKLVNDLPECKNADIAEIEIIGTKGATIEKISADIQKQLTKKVQIKIAQVQKAEVNASLIAQNIGKQLSGRGSFRKALKQSSANAMKNGAQGIKIRISGRLGGADMTRSEEHKEGRVPLHTLRADIDYGFYEALTTYGKIGIKVWVFNGMKYGTARTDEVVDQKKKGPRGRSNDRRGSRGPKSEGGKVENA